MFSLFLAIHSVNNFHSVIYIFILFWKLENSFATFHVDVQLRCRRQFKFPSCVPAAGISVVCWTWSAPATSTGLSQCHKYDLSRQSNMMYFEVKLHRVKLIGKKQKIISCECVCGVKECWSPLSLSVAPVWTSRPTGGLVMLCFPQSLGSVCAHALLSRHACVFEWFRGWVRSPLRWCWWETQVLGRPACWFASRMEPFWPGASSPPWASISG